MGTSVNKGSYIYFYDDNGNLTGVQDNVKGISRLPTPQEKLLYGKLPNNNKSGGGTTPSPTPTTTTPSESGETTPPSAAYVEIPYQDERGNTKYIKGVQTSTGKFYPTLNNQFLPTGFVQGFGDVRKDSITVVPKNMTQYTKATKEGASITVVPEPIDLRQTSIKDIYNKSYSPEMIDLGNGLVLNKPQPKGSVFENYYRNPVLTKGYIFKQFVELGYSQGKQIGTSVSKVVIAGANDIYNPKLRFADNKRLFEFVVPGIEKEYSYKTISNVKPSGTDIFNTALIPLSSFKPVQIAIGSYMLYGAQKKIRQNPSILKTEPVGIISEVGMAALFFKPSVKFAFEDVIVGIDKPKKPFVKSRTEIIDLMINGRRRTIGQFEILGLKKPRYAYTTPRIETWFAKTFDIKNYYDLYAVFGKNEIIKTPGGLRNKYPSLKQIVIEPEKLSIITTEKFIFKNGKILRPLRQKGTKDVLYTLNVITNKRNSPIIFGRVTGETFEQITYKTFNKNRLSKSQQISLSELELEAGIIPKNTKIDFGTIASENLFKMTKNNKVTPIKYGNRITRGELIGLQISKAKLSNSFGEKELLQDYLVTYDVTRPPIFRTNKKGLLEEFNRPKQRQFIGGKTLYSSIETTESKGLFDSISSLKITKPKTKTLSLTELKGGTALRLSTTLKTTVRITQQTNNKASNLILPRSITSTQQKNNNKTLFNQKLTFEVKQSYQIKQNYISKTMTITKNDILNIPRTVTRNTTKYMTKNLIRELPRELTKQITRQTTKQITRQSPRTTKLFKMTNKIPTNKIPTITNLSRRNKKGFISSLFGYRTFYVKKGKQIYLPGVRTKGSAIRYGELLTLSNLRATFGVKKTKMKITGKDRNYQPSSLFFRSYKIKKGRQVPLNDMFIQKRGKRLSFAGEIRELQRARSMKI